MSPLQLHDASSFQDPPHPFVPQFQTASVDGAGRGSSPPPHSAPINVISTSSYPSTSSPSNKHQPLELASMITKPSDSATSSTAPADSSPPDTPLYKCAPLSTSASLTSPTRRSPERPQPVSRQAPVHSSSSSSTAATTPSGSSKASGLLPQPAPEVNISVPYVGWSQVVQAVIPKTRCTPPKG